MGRKVTISITITTGLISSAIAILAIWGHARYEKSRPIFEFAATAFATVAAITGATYISKDLRQGASAAKIDRTVAYIQRWNDSGSKQREVVGLLRELKHQPSVATGEFIKDKLQEDNDLYADLTSTLNFLEEMALAIHKELVDQELLRCFFRSIVRDYANGFHDWIELRRKERKANELYIQLTTLANEWDGNGSK